MKCGAKRYFVEAEVHGEKQVGTVIARTPAEARKKFRLLLGIRVEIISVKKLVRSRTEVYCPGK